MNNNNKRWSQEEVDLLKETVRTHSHNREEAFRIVVEKTGRTAGAVNFKWYNEVKHQSSKCFISLGGNGKVIVNGTSYAPLKEKGRGTRPVSKNPREMLKLIKELLNSIEL